MPGILNFLQFQRSCHIYQSKFFDLFFDGVFHRNNLIFGIFILFARETPLLKQVLMNALFIEETIFKKAPQKPELIFSVFSGFFKKGFKKL